MVGVVLVVAVLLYGPLRQRLSSARQAPDARRARQPVRRRRRPRRRPSRAPTTRTSSWPPSPGPSPPRSACGSSSLEVDRERRRAAVTTYGDRPAAGADPAHHLSRRGRRAAGAAGQGRAQPARRPRRGSCSATWCARRPAPPAPASWPRRSSRAASGWSPLARRSGAGSVATSTTVSAPPSAASSSSWRRRGWRSTADPSAPATRWQGSAGHVPGRRRRRTPAGARPATAGPRRPGTRRRDAAAGRAASRPRLAVPRGGDDLERRLPAAVEVAAYRIAGEALANVARHAGTPARPRRPRPRRRRLVIEVADDGVGIDPDASGGVGLVSLRERAAELGGTRRASPAPRRRHGRRRPCQSGARHDSRPRPRREIRVVVVDDHQIVRDGLVALLGALDGHRASSAPQPTAARRIHVVGETAPDVVVMDIQMPQLDGIEATRFITGRAPRRPGRDADHERGRRHHPQRDPRRRLRLPAQGLRRRRGPARDPGRGRAAGWCSGRRLAARVAALLRRRATPVCRADDAVPRPDRAGARRAGPAGRRPLQRRRSPRELYVSNKTVRNAVSSIYAKLHASGRADAIVKAREAGYGRDPGSG